MKPLVIYHDHCTDGFGAAFAAWLKLGDTAEYLPMNYNERLMGVDLASMADHEVYILDFSFPRETMDWLFANAKRVVWLDHHKTAFEMWCGGYERGMRRYGSEGTNHPHWIELDDNKSGALLTWEYFHPGIEVPKLIQHIDDRDRWQFKLEGSKELHAALGSMKPWSFEQWHETLDLTDSVAIEQMIDEGYAILRAQDAHVQSMAKQARKCRISFDVRLNPGLSGKGLDDAEWFDFGLAVNTPMHQSEVGDELANQSGTFGLVWYVAGDNRVRCSLRSNGDYDVSGIARAFGGGGHRNAAGFEIDINTIMGWLK